MVTWAVKGTRRICRRYQYWSNSSSRAGWTSPSCPTFLSHTVRPVECRYCTGVLMNAIYSWFRTSCNPWQSLSFSGSPLPPCASIRQPRYVKDSTSSTELPKTDTHVGLTVLGVEPWILVLSQLISRPRGRASSCKISSERMSIFIQHL